MAELARGAVTDRAWGRTLGAVGIRGLTGQVTLSDGKQAFQIAFYGGAVVAAHSPLASDAAVRVALTGSLVSSTQVAEIARRQAAAPHRDEIEVLAELARLSPDQAMRLRRRVIAQRAARTFSVDRGQFIVEDEITLPVVDGSALDIRAVIYLGARQFLSEARLDAELSQMGTWFQLRPDADDDLPQFGFGDQEQWVIEPLRQGARISELERPELDPRMIRAVVYALTSCNAAIAELGDPGLSRPTPRPAPPEPVSPPQRPAAAAARPLAPTAAPPRPTAPTAAPPRPAAPVAAARPPSPEPIDAPTLRRAVDVDPATVRRGNPIDVPTTPARKRGPSLPANRVRDDAQAAEVQSLIAARVGRLDQGADHFALLGVSRDATKEQIRTAYFALAKQLHPDRLSSLGIADEERRAQRLFAEVNTAFSVLSDPQRRKEYQDLLARGGSRAVRDEQQRAEEMASRVLESEESFRRGEQALKRDQITTALRELERAVELNPDEPDYHAALAWARFCAASDKLAVAPATRQALEQAARKSPHNATAKFYRARVERMLGKDQDALKLFREVLEMQPNHAEATAEIRVLEQRLAGDKGGGLFGRSKR